MMTFYAALGNYQIQTVDGHKVPYIQRLGKLHPISIPEFVIWSTLLWEVMTYDECKIHFEHQMRMAEMSVPNFDELLGHLVKRKLIVKGVGYTGGDALYRMVADTFVIPYDIPGYKKLFSALKYWLKGEVSLMDLLIKRRDAIPSDAELRVLSLIEQTPLNGSELVRCFDRNVTDVSSAEKVMKGIYLSADQLHITNERIDSPNRGLVMEAVANLYLKRKVLLELP